MTNSRAKGIKAEKDAARWLTRECDWPTKRRLAGNGQAGDLMIDAAPHVVVDVKDRPQPAVVSWLEQLDAEADGRPCQVLLWKPFSKGPDPAEWLAVVANHPLDWFTSEIGGHLRDGDLSDLGTRELRAALGWLEIEHNHYADGSSAVALFWDSIEFGEWLLMRASTWATEVLPCWEAQT